MAKKVRKASTANKGEAGSSTKTPKGGGPELSKGAKRGGGPELSKGATKTTGSKKKS